MDVQKLLMLLWEASSNNKGALFTGVTVMILIAFWMNRRAYREKLDWVHEVPGLPVLGCVLELGKSTEILNVFSRYCNRFNGLCRLNLFGKSYLLATDYDFMAYMLKSQHLLNKHESYRFLKNWLGTGILTADGPRWRKSRKMLDPSFHQVVLRQFVEIFDKQSNILVDLLKKEVNNTCVDVFPYMTMYTLDNICESAMGVPIDAQTNKQSDFVHAVKEMCRIAVDRTITPIKMYDLTYPLTEDYYKEKQYVKTLHDKTNSVITSRMTEIVSNNIEQDPQEVPDEDAVGAKKKMSLLDSLLQARIEGEPLSNDEIRQEVDTVMFAGHDTTASAVSFIIYCLATYPEHQKKVVEELDTIFGEDKDRPITSKDLHSMKYLEMVINETMRLYPPVPLIGRETHEDVLYQEGKVLPAGLSIILSLYGAMRNPQFFPNPEKFDPTRFDDGKRPAPYAFIPFSAGPRNCIGQKFAMMEMKSTIAKLLLKFEFVSCDHKLILAAETILISKSGVKVTLKLRK